MINALCLKCTKQFNATNSLWLHFYGMGWREMAGLSHQCGSVTISATSVLSYNNNSLKIVLRKNGFIKIRLRSEVHVNKKHWLTQSAWLSLEHEVLCDSLQSNGLSPSHTHKQHNDINNTASNILLFLGRCLFILPSVGTLKGMS